MPITLNAVNSVTINPSSTSVVNSGITTTENNELIIAFVFGGDNGLISNWSSPGFSSDISYTSVNQGSPSIDIIKELADFSTTSGADTSHSFSHVVKGTAGSTNSITATHGATARHGMIVASFKMPVTTEIPTLSNVTVYDITPTTARPRVTITFP